MQIFIQLQTPTVELEIKSERDPAGNFGKIRAGFRRYDAIEGQKRYATLLDELSAAEKLEDPDESLKRLHQIILQEVEYFSKAVVHVKEGTQLKELTVDTRKPPAELWSTSEQAVSELLMMYISSSPWRNNLLSALFNSFSNRDLADLAEVKN